MFFWEKVLFMKLVFVLLLLVDMVSVKVYLECLYGNVKCLCLEGCLCIDFVFWIVFCIGGIYFVFILFVVLVWIFVWIGGFVKEVVFDLVLFCNSLFLGIMEGLFVMFFGWYVGKDIIGEVVLCFFVCKK